METTDFNQKKELLLAFWDWYCKEKDVDSKYTKEEMIEAFLKNIKLKK